MFKLFILPRRIYVLNILNICELVHICRCIKITQNNIVMSGREDVSVHFIC